MTIHTPPRDKARSRISKTAAWALLTGLIVLAGCGSSSNSSSSPTTSSAASSVPASGVSTGTATTPASTGAAQGATHVLSVAADPEGQLKFTSSSLAARAGKVTITFTNSSPLSHNLAIASSSGESVGATETFKGGSKKLSVTLKAGTYKFFCTVPGHRQAGMEGTLVVS